MFRPAVVASLLATSAVARADEPAVTLVPSCAVIDAEHDALSVEERESARRLLVRVLERADLLVVEAGCVDHYTLAHDVDGSELTIHLAGPRGRRRMRHVNRADLSADYTRMVDALLAEAPPPEAPPEEASPAAEAPSSVAPEEVSPEVTPQVPPQAPASDDSSVDTVEPAGEEPRPAERILYGQLGIGTYGTNYALGYRRGDRNHAFDMSLRWASGDAGGFVAGRAAELYVQNPHASSTVYIGAGLSLASQHEGQMSGSGVRLEATAGISFARWSALSWFTQVDLAVPLYTVAMDIIPTASVSLGAGF